MRQQCTITTTVITIVIIYVITIISQLSRFVESHYEPVDVQSLIAPNRSVVSCRQQFADWVRHLFLHYYALDLHKEGIL